MEETLCRSVVGFEHVIETGHHRPVRSLPRRLAPAERETVQLEVEEMMKAGVIEPSYSPWASPVVLVKKKDGGVRFCVDYRKVNEVTEKDVYPLPRIDDVLDQLNGARYFVKLDLYKGYWQVPVRPEHIPKTAFSTPDGHYQFHRMPFGLCNAPASFQRMMDHVLGSLKWKKCLVFMDDILIFARTFRELLERLGEVLEALGKANLRLQKRKCEFGMTVTTYLGHRIGAEGVAPDPAKVEAISNFPRPTNLRSVRRFLGMIGYYRHFLQFGQVASPLTQLLRKNVAWHWGKEQEEAFQVLVQRLSSIPVLGHLDPSLPLVVYTDAGGVHCPAIRVSRAAAVFSSSRQLKDEESRWHPNELECLAVVWALKRLRPYVYGRDVVVRTDSTVARSLLQKKDLTGKQDMWVEALAEFEPGLKMEHCSGRKNVVADALSRANDSSGVGLDYTSGAPLAAAAVSASQSPFSAEEVALRQARDAELEPIVAGLQEPSSEVRLREDGFDLRGGILFRRKWLLAVPKSLRFEITRSCHEEPTAGHEGQKKTVGRVQERFWWRGLSSYVRKTTCTTCLVVFILSAAQDSQTPSGGILGADSAAHSSVPVLGD